MEICVMSFDRKENWQYADTIRTTYNVVFVVLFFSFYLSLPPQTVPMQIAGLAQQLHFVWHIKCSQPNIWDAVSTIFNIRFNDSLAIYCVRMCRKHTTHVNGIVDGSRATRANCANPIESARSSPNNKDPTRTEKSMKMSLGLRIDIDATNRAIKIGTRSFVAQHQHKFIISRCVHAKNHKEYTES